MAKRGPKAERKAAKQQKQGQAQVRAASRHRLRLAPVAD